MRSAPSALMTVKGGGVWRTTIFYRYFLAQVCACIPGPKIAIKNSCPSNPTSFHRHQSWRSAPHYTAVSCSPWSLIHALFMLHPATQREVEWSETSAPQNSRFGDWLHDAVTCAFCLNVCNIEGIYFMCLKSVSDSAIMCNTKSGHWHACLRVTSELSFMCRSFTTHTGEHMNWKTDKYNNII